MKRVFLYGNSHTLSEIIYDINTLTNLSVDSIIMLSDIKRTYYSRSNLKFCFFNTPSECIDNCDDVLIFQSDGIPIEVINYITEYSTEKRKRWNLIRENNNAHINSNIEKLNCFDKPVIFSVSYGDATSSLCCDLLIEREFQKKNIELFHIFSDKYLQLLKQLDACCILNDRLRPSLDVTAVAPVTMVSLDINKNPASLIEQIDLILAIKPDYILFQTDCSYKDSNELSNVAKYICNRQLDAWIVNRFYPIHDNVECYQSNPLMVEGCYDLEDNTTGEKISFDIISKIAYPVGVKKFK